jgi:predicted aspartyl protease
MSVPFHPQQGLVMVHAAVDGPSGSAVLQLALDTGATGTMINAGMLVALGYDPALAPERIQVTTGSGVEFVPRLVLDKIVALGQERFHFPVLAHTLPPSAGIDGLLGLDFIRGYRLTVDFRTGMLTLS